MQLCILLLFDSSNLKFFSCLKKRKKKMLTEKPTSSALSYEPTSVPFVLTSRSANKSFRLFLLGSFFFFSYFHFIFFSSCEKLYKFDCYPFCSLCCRHTTMNASFIASRLFICLWSMIRKHSRSRLFEKSLSSGGRPSAAGSLRELRPEKLSVYAIA